MKHAKLWSVGCVGLALLLLMAAGAVTAVIDPYFHYHAPLEGLQYPLNNQRYQNDGIVKHFSYDAVIAGTSMTENYRTTQFDRLFGTRSVKACYSGGTIQELTATLEAGLKANPELKLVLLCMDEWFLFSDKTMILADGEYPTYLYDDLLYNDVKYLLNKDVLLGSTLEVLDYTAQGNRTTSFDDFGSWRAIPIGREHAMAQFTRAEKADVRKEFTPELRQRVANTMNASILKLAKDYPDTTFLVYFPPYSILNWDTHSREGTLQRQVAACEFASGLMLEQENIRLFSFCADFETITDLDNYRDSVHHSTQISELLLERMAGGEYQLTEDTNAGHWKAVLDFYESYPYDSLFS